MKSELSSWNTQKNESKTFYPTCSPRLYKRNTHLGILPLDLEHLWVFEDDGAVGPLGVGGRGAAEGLAVGLGGSIHV